MTTPTPSEYWINECIKIAANAGNLDAAEKARRELAAAQKKLDEAWELNGLKLNEIGTMQAELAAAQERIARLEKREQWAANLLDIAKRDAKLPATLLQGIAQFQDERRADFPKEEPR